MPKINDLAGKKFGQLTVLGAGTSRPRIGHVGTTKYWRCRCECGRELEVETQNLRRRNPSCGCKKREKIRAALTRHGHTSRDTISGEWRCWASMRRRCRQPDDKDAKYYEGIAVCERWQEFENFLADMGPRPSPRHSIDRIDGTKGYEPGNCRWATKREQSLNRCMTIMLTFNGETMCAKDWATKLGVDSRLIYSRLARKMPLEKVLTTKRHPPGSPTKVR